MKRLTSENSAISHAADKHLDDELEVLRKPITNAALNQGLLFELNDFR